MRPSRERIVMSQGSNNGVGLATTILTIVSAVAATGLGAWIFKFLQYRADWTVRRGEVQEKRERTIIDEYQKILDDKDHDLKDARDEWAQQRNVIMKEAAGLRRTNQAYILDMEAMRVRIETLNKELLAYRQGKGYAQDALDAVIHTDGQGDIYWCNETASMFLRTPIEKMYTLNVSEFVPKDFIAQHNRGIARARQRGPLPRGEVNENTIRARVLLPDRSEIPVDLYMSQFWIGDVMVCRAQIRRNFERQAFAADPSPVYVPSSASASGVNLAQAAPTGVKSDGPGKS